MMFLSECVLPEEICGKVDGFGDGRTGRTSEPKPEGFKAKSPGPPVEPRFCETGSVRPAGFTCFRAAGAHVVGSLDRTPGTPFATLRVDRLAHRETELPSDKNVMVY